MFLFTINSVQYAHDKNGLSQRLPPVVLRSDSLGQNFQFKKPVISQSSFYGHKSSKVPVHDFPALDTWSSCLCLQLLIVVVVVCAFGCLLLFVCLFM